MEPLKIAVITHYLPQRGKKTGGVSVVAQRLALGLATMGHEVTVFSVNPPSDGTTLRWSSFASNRFLSKLCQLPVLDLIFVPILLIFKDLSGFDILHFHGNDTFYIGKRPRVRTMHGSSLREYQHTQSRLRKIVLLLSYAFERISVLRMDETFCIGSDTALIYGLGTQSIVPNPVNSENFYPGEKTKYPQVFYNGYWKGRKRGRFIYERFIADVLPHFPDARLIFLGNHCPPHPQVDLVTGATDEQLAQYYRESWVFAYPSTYEGFGLAYVEAMASGTAVLASPNSGACDVLDNGRTGVVASDDTFGEKLLELISDAEQRSTYEALGLERAQEYQQNKVVVEYAKRFEEVIRREARR